MDFPLPTFAIFDNRTDSRPLLGATFLKTILLMSILLVSIRLTSAMENILFEIDIKSGVR